eukprot:g4251.t1
MARRGSRASNSSIGSDDRRRQRSGERRRKLSRYHPECIENPMWTRRVDAASYEYGCNEIEEMLTGDIQLVGNGKVRDVYFAEYSGRKVVVKTLRQVDGLNAQKKQLGMHRREVVVLDALAGDPHIVNILGLCGTTVVTEYFEDNFLRKIHRHRHTLEIRTMVSLALDVARGMQALHEVVGGVHMDMKPQQLLIDDYGRGKVNDFNSIHFMKTNADVKGEFCPTHAGKPVRMIPWRSPENVAGEDVTDKADIYSLGMIFYSLLNGAPPYPTEDSFKRALIYKTRPKMDPSWHKGFVKVIEAMWRENPQDRPCARKIVAKLETILDELR